MVMKCIFGSHLYGCDTPESDKDYKGIYLPNIEDCILNKIPKSFSKTSGDDRSKNTKEDIDEEIYSLQYFIELACEGQTIALDMIHCNDECLIENSDIWEEIRKNRNKFYTKNLKAFVSYCRTQSAKYGIKGSRLNTSQEVLNFLNTYKGKSYKLQDVWDKLPSLEHTYILDDPKNKDIKLYQVCGKKFQSTSKINYIIPILEKFYNDYGERAKLAKENKNIDWKSLSHAIRAALQTKEILTTMDLVFPLKDAKLLLDVKQGKLDYTTEIAPMLENLMDEVEELSKLSTLPEKVDRKFWDDFIVSCYL